MNNKLTLGLFQYDIKWNSRDENLQFLDSNIADAFSKNTIDILFFPEMFQTGFNMKPVECAEEMSGSTVKWMQQIARNYHCAVAGSISCKNDNGYVNRFLFVTSNTVEYYDKKHLFTLANEHKSFEPGRERVVMQYKDWRIFPQICYDLRFPVWSRNDLNYDMMVYVANWPASRSHHWNALLKARAIENQAYVIGVNRVGHDQNGWRFEGDTSCYAPDGLLEHHIGDGNAGVIIAEVSKDKILNTRSTMSFLQDRDNFQVI